VQIRLSFCCSLKNLFAFPAELNQHSHLGTTSGSAEFSHRCAANGVPGPGPFASPSPPTSGRGRIHFCLEPRPTYIRPRLASSLGTTRRFPPPWSVEDIDAAFVVRDNNGLSLAYVYFEEEPGRRSAAKLLSKDERGGSRGISPSCRSLMHPPAHATSRPGANYKYCSIGSSPTVT
jgi:hypothetical protein